MTTAIIIHPDVIHHQPANSRRSHRSLETHGPIPGDFEVHHRPGHFLGTASFDEFKTHQAHFSNIHKTRRPIERESWIIKTAAARRVISLLEHAIETSSISLDILREIRWRVMILEGYSNCHSVEDWWDLMNLLLEDIDLSKGGEG